MGRIISPGRPMYPLAGSIQRRYGVPFVRFNPLTTPAVGPPPLCGVPHACRRRRILEARKNKHAARAAGANAAPEAIFAVVMPLRSDMCNDRAVRCHLPRYTALASAWRQSPGTLAGSQAENGAFSHATTNDVGGSRWLGNELMTFDCG